MCVMSEGDKVLGNRARKENKEFQMSIWLHMEKGLSGKITYDILTNKETQESLPGFYNFWGGGVFWH